MDANENANASAAVGEQKTPAGIGWKLFNVFSKIDTQTVAVVILFLLSLQPLFGIIEKTPAQYDLVAFYYAKTILIRFLGCLGAANWLMDFYCKVYIHKKDAWKQTFLKRPWTGFLAVLLVWSLFAILIAYNKDLAFFGAAYRYEGFLSYLAYAGIFLNAALIRGEKQRNILFAATAAVSSALAALTLIKEAAGSSFLMFRNGQVGAFSGTFINSNHYGYYLCVSLIVIAGLYMSSAKLWGKLLCGFCFTLNLVVLLYNGSLGPYLAIAVGLALYFVFCLIRKGFKKSSPLLVLIALFVGLSFLLNGQKVIKDIGLISRQTGEVIEVIQSGSSDTPEGRKAIESIGSARGALWEKTLKIIRENPVMGVGTDNVQLYINNGIPHNEYLQIAANLGIPGIALWLAALLSCFAFAVKNLKKLSDGALFAGMAVLVYCVSAFTGISIPVAAYQLFFFLGMLTGWFKKRDETVMNEKLMARLEQKSDVPQDPAPEE